VYTVQCTEYTVYSTVQYCRSQSPKPLRYFWWGFFLCELDSSVGKVKAIPTERSQVQFLLGTIFLHLNFASSHQHQRSLKFRLKWNTCGQWPAVIGKAAAFGCLRFQTQFFTIVPNFDDSGHHRDYLYYKVRWVKLFKLEIQGYKPVTAKLVDFFFWST